MGGGIPENTNTLVVGTPGTGKTIFALEFLYQGALKGEAGVYVSFEQTEKELKMQASELGLDFDKLKTTVSFIIIPPDAIDLNLLEDCEDVINKLKAKRLVIDSLAILSVNSKSYALTPKNVPEKYAGVVGKNALKPGVTERDMQHFIYVLLNQLKSFGTTNLVITDGIESSSFITRDGVSEFACDGVILLRAVLGDEAFRTLSIIKMRTTKQQAGLINFRIDNGIIVESEGEGKLN